MGQEADEPGEEPEGLLDRLAQVPDPRSRHGRRYPLQVLLGIVVAAVLSGARTYTEVGEFAAELSQEQLAALGCVRRPWEARYQAPGESALRRLLQRLDVEALDRLVGGGWPPNSPPHWCMGPVRSWPSGGELGGQDQRDRRVRGPAG